MTNRPLAPLFAIAAVAVLAACTTTTPSAGGDSSGSAGGGSSSAGDCPTVAGFEYFSADIITTAPAEGQVFGDGTEITFEGPAELVPLYVLSYVDDAGEAVEVQNSAFDPSAPKGTYTTVNNVFDSDANGKYGIFELQTIDDGSFSFDDDVSKNGDTVTLGRYCVSIETE